MTTLCSENVSPESKSIIVAELLQGHDSASQLKLLLQNLSSADGPHSAQQLLAKIQRSFDQSISILTSPEAAGGHVGQNPLISGENGSPVGASGNDRRPRDSGESRKRSSPTAKDRRGCYKRRKTADTWTQVSNTVDDNHAWRKYGQKHILNSKFPRSYFRCTRKYDKGCKAIKQVQRIQENPEKFQTTYIGIHTCKDILKAPELVNDSGNWESFLVSQSKVPNKNDDQMVMMMHGPSLITSSLSSSPSIKQEYPKEDTPLSDVTDNLDHSLWSDLKDIELSEPSIMPSTMASAYNADTVYSCTASTMDFGVESVGFGTDHDDHFHFD